MQYFHHQNTFQLKLVNALIGYRANLRANGGRELRQVSLNKKTTTQNGFGNKSAASPYTLVIPIELAEEVRFELTEDFHPRQFSRLVHSTALPLFLCSEVANYKELLLNPA